MRLIHWNCQGAFRNKNKLILLLNPDIIVVSECESKEKLHLDKAILTCYNCLWFGEDSNKGIGVFYRKEYSIRLLKDFYPNYKYVLPLEVAYQRKSFVLFVVWAKNDKTSILHSYIGQVWRAINYYQPLLSKDVVLIGDFNSNSQWDNMRSVGNHTDVVEFLEKYGIRSLYHLQENEEQGKETQDTFFMNRNIDRGYHIDYVFSSRLFYLNNAFKVSVCSPGDWLDISDHVPIILDFQITLTHQLIETENTFSNFLDRHRLLLSSSTQEKYKDCIDKLFIIANDLDLATKNNDSEQYVLHQALEKLKLIDNTDKSLEALICQQ